MKFGNWNIHNGAVIADETVYIKGYDEESDLPHPQDTNIIDYVRVYLKSGTIISLEDEAATAYLEWNKNEN